MADSGSAFGASYEVQRIKHAQTKTDEWNKCREQIVVSYPSYNG